MTKSILSIHWLRHILGNIDDYKKANSVEELKKIVYEHQEKFIKNKDEWAISMRSVDWEDIFEILKKWT